jgi:hypothetical protein
VRSFALIGILAAASFFAAAPAAAQKTAVPAQADAHGTISLDARLLPGSEAFLASGNAPVSTPIDVTVVGTISRDLPDVLISRRQIVSNATGRFSVVIPIAPNYFRGSILTVVASAPAGVAPGRAQLIVGAPNNDVSVPAEQLPRSFR